ncbi:MAG: nucleoside triphosphate pyrophosphohydrolase [Alphaproteobacteria bacterium]|nr:nucleoside triphosphate pyrophosphohydrolase [Alphaproteobacteria bacterium]MBU1513729.1 nucleoside triphosphate pyrophosphohydrolase [Alphaproteobacteria bacterium]MBU2094626.1 nucleoside triphosphate pyrophosphohydrolase [Alphaproteobacteria bacterium]MBU2150305.1 nucleoside triphosphate pyrophosphohydrolase [Alphaproteobacteria bacterium]MBU2309166.1 nucleoside triphosphate pyrophosphohydrolase [Alphaproteobacteria bacterium]
MTRPAPPADLAPLDRLLAIMARLRDAKDGCPWDLEQTFETIAPYTVEEAYEVADAIERGDLSDLKDELGDLLLQVVFHSRIAEEQGAFAFDDVARAINDKMVRRHPHVFADETYASLDDQKQGWEDLKAVERAGKGKAQSLLDDVPIGLPGLTRAVKLSKRAATVGFVWPTVQDVVAKLHEEVGEMLVEIEAGDLEKAKAEIGDVLFVVANLARTLDVDPEDAVRATNAKFVRRFSYVEQRLAERGKSPAQSDLAEMDGLWDDAKAAERA